MRFRTRTAVTAALGATLLATAGVTATAATVAPASARTWRIAYQADIDGSNFQSVLAISANDVWAVGQSNDYGNYNVPVIRRWNGRFWTDVHVPATFSHSGPTAIAASEARDVWVFGEYVAGDVGPAGNSVGLVALLLRRGYSWPVSGRPWGSGRLCIIPLSRPVSPALRVQAGRSRPPGPAGARPGRNGPR
jgi:hypothetical protein